MNPHKPQCQRRRPHGPAGGAAGPVLLIVAALAISAAVFFLYTRRKMERREVAVQQSVEAAEVKKPALPPPSVPEAKKEPEKPAPPKPAPAAKFGFARPMDLGRKMADFLASGDFESAGQLAAAGSPEMAAQAAEVFRRAVEDLGFKPGREEKVDLVGVVGDQTRLTVPLTGPDGRALALELDVMRDPGMGWKIGKLRLPKALGEALASLPVPPLPASATASMPDGAPAPAGVGSNGPMKKEANSAVTKPNELPSVFSILEKPDSLSFASNFVKQLLDHNFEAAVALTDPDKVSAERLAGLCIVFEEGGYALRENKPLVTTVASPEVSWVIAQVESEELQQTTEFGLELQSDPDAGWRVVGINLSEILGSFAQSASKLGVPYTPIVKNPKGGESVALYFEYDSADLHPRATKQLEIVAALLKSDHAKHLLITGHTDARGTDDYNLRLSDARAESVKEKLVELGVPATQVETKGFGKALPLGPNQLKDGSDNPEGRSRNRRAEIFLDF